ncbi:MAG: hypothetical protein KDJ41_06880 [Hyphomicrobiaceae bacterium]|nr:hypothetical protein [Hyphomicrobiaceae bacterium]
MPSAEAARGKGYKGRTAKAKVSRARAYKAGQRRHRGHRARTARARVAQPRIRQVSWWDAPAETPRAAPRGRAKRVALARATKRTRVGARSPSVAPANWWDPPAPSARKVRRHRHVGRRHVRAKRWTHARLTPRRPARQRPIRLAALGPAPLASVPRPGTGSSIVRYASGVPSSCVPAGLKSVLYAVANRFGTVTVSSTLRRSRHNRRVGGARRSWHLQCRAVDFRVHGNTRGLMAFLRSQPAVGGLKRYAFGFYHIDNGPRRSW